MSPGATVADQLDDRNSLIRKHGTQLMAIADYETPVPSAFWSTDTTTTPGKVLTLPAVLPEGFRNLGYITTDGISESRDVGSSDLNMVQDIEPVRSDIDSLTRTLQVTFGESSSWTKALAHNKPVRDWPATRSSSFEFYDGEESEFPYYRILILTQDGVGAGAVYRVEFAYRAKVTDMGDRTLNRTDAEMTQRTFTCYKDEVVGRSYATLSEPAVKLAA